jgi:putative ATPase
MPNEVVSEIEMAPARVFQVVIGNLLAEPVDAIVNAANGHLAHGRGVAAVIAGAAGPALERDGDRIVGERGAIPVGDAVVTVPGRLPYQAVIHTVGPRQGEGDEEAKLVRALKSAFARADERGWTSVAFPAVSSGIFAVPLETCARAYVAAVREFWSERPNTSLRLIRLCLVRGPLVKLVRDVLGA